MTMGMTISSTTRPTCAELRARTDDLAAVGKAVGDHACRGAQDGQIVQRALRLGASDKLRSDEFSLLRRLRACEVACILLPRRLRAREFRLDRDHAGLVRGDRVRHFAPQQDEGRPRRLCARTRSLDIGLRLRQARACDAVVDAHQHLSRLHAVALARGQVDNAPGQFAGNNDAIALDPAVGLNQSLGQRAPPLRLPQEQRRGARQDRHKQEADCEFLAEVQDIPVWTCRPTAEKSRTTDLPRIDADQSCLAGSGLNVQYGVLPICGSRRMRRFREEVLA